MPYQVNVFKSWLSFNTWDDLKQWLVSEAGGLLRVVEPRDSQYALVRYTKGTSNFTLPHVRWCRSVVVHKESRLPVSIAPPKASELTDTSVNSATIAEEFVDGTMVNVFHTANDEVASVATRSRLGADKSYTPGTPSFREMLDAALVNQGVASLDAMLPVNGYHRFTSVVLQHPLNRVVKYVEKAAFVIVHQGSVEADGTVHLEEDASNFVCLSSLDDDGTEVQPYSLASVLGAKSVKDWVSAQALERGFGWQGLVLKDGAGNRWRQRSEVYETVRRLRGNTSTSAERYANQRRTRTTEQYLSFYPEDRDTFYNLEGLLRKNTRNLFHFYVDTFRSRKTAFHELPWPYKHHVSVLHNYFKNTLREQKKKVDLQEVIHYVNTLANEDLANMMKEHVLTLRVKTGDEKAEGKAEAKAEGLLRPEEGCVMPDAAYDTGC